MNIQLFLKRRPAGRMRGLNPRVKETGLADQGDQTRIKPVGQLNGGGSGRVSSFLGFASRVGSCQGVFRFSQVGSGQVDTPQKGRWLGRVS